MRKTKELKRGAAKKVRKKQKRIGKLLKMLYNKGVEIRLRKKVRE